MLLNVNWSEFSIILLNVLSHLCLGDQCLDSMYVANRLRLSKYFLVRYKLEIIVVFYSGFLLCVLHLFLVVEEDIMPQLFLYDNQVKVL
jgi:hypothetical protein